jgi:hypothetical protein
MKKASPELSDDYWEEFMAEINPENFTRIVIPVYQKHFSEEEIQTILEFYNSPEGMKFIRLSPVLISESQIAFENWCVEMSGRIYARHRSKP